MVLVFIEAQRYTIDQNIVFQDNQYTIRLALNGSMYSSSHTKHIKAQYYFVKDKVEEGEVDIRYCPTKRMWSNILNKLKQGALFRRDRAMLMKVPINYDDRVGILKTNPGL